MSTHKGPGVDLPALERWLDARIGLEGPLEARLLTGGRSNLTYQLQSGAARFVLRRPPLEGVLRGAHDVEREYRITEALQSTVVPVAPTVLMCRSSDVIGAPFSIIRFVDGVTLRSSADLGKIAPGGRPAIVTNFMRTLAALHGLDPAVSGLCAAKGNNFAARQLRIWRRQLEAASPSRPLPGLEDVAQKLLATIPDQRQVSIVHGDYRLDNVLFSSDAEVLAVIDWELWTLGDPSADLCSAIVYWHDSPYELAPLGDAPTSHGQLGSRDDLLAEYESARGRRIESREFNWYMAFSTWRFAAILEGVYRRNLLGVYGAPANDHDWRRYCYVVPALAEVAGQHLERA